MDTAVSKKFHLKRVLIAIGVVFMLGIGVVWYSGVVPWRSFRPPQNSILVIAPYRYNGTWVFDDPRFGLVREPFVAGVPEMIDVLVADIPDADKGFRLTFSSRKFPGFQRKLDWVRGDMDGNYYKIDNPPMEGWICPAMFKYYDKPPAELYVKAEPISPN
jgi:hypothetical protein